MTTTEEEKNFFIYLRKPTIHTLIFEEEKKFKVAVTVTTLEKSKTITTTFKISNSKTEF